MSGFAAVAHANLLALARRCNRRRGFKRALGTRARLPETRMRKPFRGFCVSQQRWRKAALKHSSKRRRRALPAEWRRSVRTLRAIHRATHCFLASMPSTQAGVAALSNNDDCARMSSASARDGCIDASRASSLCSIATLSTRRGCCVDANRCVGASLWQARDEA